MLESLDVQVDWTRPDGTSAWQRNSRVTVACDQGTKHKRGGAHRLHQFVWCFRANRTAAMNRGAVMRASVAQFDVAAHRDQQLTHCSDIANFRNALEDHGFIGEQGSRHRG